METIEELKALDALTLANVWNCYINERGTDSEKHTRKILTDGLGDQWEIDDYLYAWEPSGILAAINDARKNSIMDDPIEAIWIETDVNGYETIHGGTYAAAIESVVNLEELAEYIDNRKIPLAELIPILYEEDDKRYEEEERETEKRVREGEARRIRAGMIRARVILEDIKKNGGTIDDALEEITKRL